MTNKKTILLVDDEPSNRQSVYDFLLNSNERFEILVGTNGKQAVDIAFNKLPDLILMDWEMPVMNGIEAIRNIKKNPTCSAIPVIMFTGVRTTSEDLQEALEAGAVDFLRKPVDYVELMARINSTLLLISYFKSKIEAEQENANLIRDRKDAEIAFKQRELSAITLTMSAHNEILSKINSEIHQILLLNHDSQVEERVKNLMIKIDSILNQSNYWEEFMKQFKLLHEGFLERIQKRFPDLTQGEIKLCCFLKMNLSNKEIANLLNSSLDAVDKSRYRLRKKLYLDAQTNLFQYLNTEI